MSWKPSHFVWWFAYTLLCSFFGVLIVLGLLSIFDEGKHSVFFNDARPLEGKTVNVFFWLLSVAIGMFLAYFFVRLEIKKEREAQRELKQIRHQEEVRRARYDPQLVCPHCQTRGHVHTDEMARSHPAQSSAGDWFMALISRGYWLLPMAMRRDTSEAYIRATCSNCGQTWTIE